MFQISAMFCAGGVCGRLADRAPVNPGRGGDRACVGEMYGARPSGSGVVMASPSSLRCLLGGALALLADPLAADHVDVPVADRSSQRMHWATGEDARAARPLFGPPHCGHSPAALTHTSLRGLEAADEDVLAALVRQPPCSRHIFRRVCGCSRPRSTAGSSGAAMAALPAMDTPHSGRICFPPGIVPVHADDGAAQHPFGDLPLEQPHGFGGTWMPVARIAARAWIISICSGPVPAGGVARSSSGVSGTVSGVELHIGSASATRSCRIACPVACRSGT